MSRYGNAVYGASYYGEAPPLAYSVEPMGITVIDFTEVYVTWQQPKGNFTKFRILRHNSGFSETAEDGEVVFEQASEDGTSLEGLISREVLRDGEDNPESVKIVPGRTVYYTVFLLTEEKVWVKAGQIQDTVPADSGAYKKFLDTLPRVLTSAEVSPLGVVDDTSVLARFLQAFMFSYEQWNTSISLLQPGQTLDKSVYATIPGETFNIGFDIEPNLPVENQRRLIREGIYLQSNRGTKIGLEGYVEALTGYTPSTSLSSNIMLSVQDSTFYKSVGNWVNGSGVTSFVASTDQIPTAKSMQIDEVYSGKLTLSGQGSISLGETSPITKGVPVIGDTEYTVSCQVKSPTSAGTILLTVKFFDRGGTELSSHNASAVSATNSWSQSQVTVTSDTDAAYASISIRGSSSGVYYVDQVCFQEGDTVSYEEARCITLEVGPYKTNLILNPSFEVDAATWDISGATFDQSEDVSIDGFSETYSGEFTSSTAWTLTTDYTTPITPGFYYTASFYVKSEDITETTITINAYDSEGDLVEVIEEIDPVTDSWSRVYCSFLISSDSTATDITVSLGSEESGVILVDMVQLERTSSPTEYFDGALPSDYGALWSGTANASTSLIYPSRNIKMPRLAYTLNDWVPLNSFWRLTTPAGLEYTNLDVI